MKRLFAIVCLLALLLCACAEPEPAHVQEPISQPEDVGQAAEASEKTALLSPAAARMADLTAADIHYTDFDVDADALGAALREAASKGVNVCAYDCAVTPDSLVIRRSIPVIL